MQVGSLFPTTRKEVSPAARFKELDTKRRGLLNRCEQYAMWTLPSVFPRADVFASNQEISGPIDSTGSQAVNNLSNKLTLTLFRPGEPFFRLMASDDLLARLVQQAATGDKRAQSILDTLDKSLALAEKRAMRVLDYTHYRTEATTVSKALIVTGNSLIYHPEGKGRAQVYSLRDYVVARDLSGTVIELVTRDTKALFTFAPKIQEQIVASDKGKYNNLDKQVCLYTRIRLKEDGKYHMEQSADEVKLETSGGFWTADELPYIVLTWNLFRGEDYGRGLVEDYAGAFHGLYVLTHAFVDAVGAAADIKWLVRPTSLLDVARLNNSKSGSYHAGEEGDITAVQVNKQGDLQIVQAMITMWQQQIGRAFMLMQSVQRDAERVTAEEIRYMVNDLEVSNGGIYSRLSEEWQLRTATLILKRIDVSIDGEKVYPIIITGLDSLSRAGDLDNLRMFINDLALLNGVPEDIRMGIHPTRFMAFVGVRRGVDYEKFVKTNEELQAEQQARMQETQAAVNAEAGAKMAVDASAAALKEG